MYLPAPDGCHLQSSVELFSLYILMSLSQLSNLVNHLLKDVISPVPAHFLPDLKESKEHLCCWLMSTLSDPWSNRPLREWFWQKSQVLRHKTTKVSRPGVKQSKAQYSGHQSTHPCRGHCLGVVGGTNLYYKKEWVPREVHKDFLGVLLTVLKCKTSVCVQSNRLFWAGMRV
jgi:hypothetical protein